MNTVDAIRRLVELRQLDREGTPTPASRDALVEILKPTDKKATK